MAKKTKPETTKKEAEVEKPKHELTGAEIEAQLQERDKLIEQIQSKVPQLFGEAQRNLLLNETPKYKIKKRKGKGGKIWDYVDIGYVIEQLNILTGHTWTSEILWTTTIEEALTIKQYVVRLRLCMTTNAGMAVSKEQYGSCDIKYKKGCEKVAENLLDFGNDCKGAVSDAVKKCSSEFGIALDVYSGAVKRREDTEHPEGKISEGQRRRLDVLAQEAEIGQSGLAKLANELYDYTTPDDIQRRHFRSIMAKLEERVAVVVEKENPIPEDIDALFSMLGTPLGKRLAMFRAYEKQEKLDDLVINLNKVLTDRLNEDEGKKEAEEQKREEESGND